MDRPCLSAVYACSIWSCGAPPAGLETGARSAETGEAGCDERADAEEDVEKAEERHGSLLEDGGGVRELDAAGEADGVDVGLDGSEEAEEGDGDRDVHPKHALLCALRV